MFQNTDELIDYIRRNSHSETRYCEYKGNIRWEGEIRYKIIKTVLGMSNVRDGGNIIIGVEKNTTTNDHEPIGLNVVDANTFDNDTISATANNYADTHVEINVKRFEHGEKILVVIEVHEHGEVVICKQDQRDGSGQLILENGAVYTRRYRIPETTKATSIEMREILDSVSEKLLRDEIRRLQSLGIISIGTSGAPTSSSDVQLFEEERAGF